MKVSGRSKDEDLKTESRKHSEPHSLQAWHTVLHGKGHKGKAQEPATTVAAATLVMTPDEVYMLTAKTAEHKHHYPFPKLVVLGILAGAYIGLGFSLCCLVGGLMSYELRHDEPGLFNFLFAIFGFPMGLTLCVAAGADLFTSNCTYIVVAMAEGRYGILGALRTLLVSYFSNLAGALMLVGLMCGGEVFTNRSAFVIELVTKKAHLPWAVAFTRGILCNWLVCLAVWQGNMARDFTGKFVGIFLPNTAFVAMGFEHCIANMFLMPMGMALGADVSVGTFIGRNLVPVTLGNIVGGMVFVGGMYALSLGTPGHIIQDAWEEKIVNNSCWGRSTPKEGSGGLPVSSAFRSNRAPVVGDGEEEGGSPGESPANGHHSGAANGHLRFG